MICADWLFNLPEVVAFTQRFNQLLLLSPLTLWSLGLLLVALVIWMEDRGPVFTLSGAAA